MAESAVGEAAVVQIKKRPPHPLKRKLIEEVIQGGGPQNILQRRKRKRRKNLN